MTEGSLRVLRNKAAEKGAATNVSDQTLAQTGKAWTKVNHSVVLLGWGEDEGGNKYWVARNSYGPGWGQGGDFMIRRGQDDLGIESE